MSAELLASAGGFVLTSGIILDALRSRPERGGWLYAGVGLGIVISGVIVDLVSGVVDWRGEWLLVAAVSAVLCIGVWLWLPREGSYSDSIRFAPTTQHEDRRTVFTALFIAYLLEGAGYIVTGTFMVVLVENLPGLKGFGASVWIVAGLAAAPSCVLWAALAARSGAATALTLAYLAQAAGILLPVISASELLGGAILFGGTFLGITALTLTFARQFEPPGRAASIGVLTAAFGLGQIVGPVLAGRLADQTHSFAPALELAAAAVCVGGVLMGLLRRRVTM